MLLSERENFAEIFWPIEPSGQFGQQYLPPKIDRLTVLLNHFMTGIYLLHIKWKIPFGTNRHERVKYSIAKNCTLPPHQFSLDRIWLTRKITITLVKKNGLQKFKLQLIDILTGSNSYLYVLWYYSNFKILLEPTFKK